MNAAIRTLFYSAGGEAKDLFTIDTSHELFSPYVGGATKTITPRLIISTMASVNHREESRCFD